jgi:two-component system, chemotaxis family, chemotaxis protein CheY
VVDNGSAIFEPAYQTSSGGESKQPLYLPSQASHALSRIGVLVVEQNPAIQDMLCWALELAGYSPLAQTPEYIVHHWHNHQMLTSEKIALLLLDVSFPWEEEGLEFLRMLRSHWATSNGIVLPIIVLTTSERIYQELLEQGEQVEKKPFHINQLITRVQGLLRSPTSDEAQ